MTRLETITQAAARVVEAKALLERPDVESDPDVIAARNVLLGVIRLLTAAMAREARWREEGKANT